MSRDWKPGDLAMTAKNTVALCGKSGRFIDTDGAPWSDERHPGNLRPLVVIDPEDREQVRELADRAFPEAKGNTNRLQAALREFANPTPTIEEPTGLGAVVEDANGRLWVRAEKAKGMQNPWQDTLSDDPASDRIRAVAYAEISVVRVLSEGIS